MPTESSTIYSGPINPQPSGIYIKAYAREDGYYDSDAMTFQGWL